MSWWVALIVAVSAGMGWTCALLSFTPADTPNGDVPGARGGLTIMSGISVAIGLYVTLLVAA